MYPSLWQSGHPHAQSRIDNVVNHAKKYDTTPKSSPFFSRMRSEGFPFMVWGSGGWTLVPRQLVVATFSHRLRVVNSVSMGKAAKPRLFWCADVAVSIGEAAKPQSLLLLWRRRVLLGKLLIRLAALTSACLWGKLQKLSLCFSSGVTVSMGEAAKPRSGTWCKLCSTKYYWEVVCASFVVHSSTGK